MTNEELIVTAREGDCEALHQLFEQNKGLIFEVAKQFKRKHDDMSDLLSDCRVEFYKAFVDFDLSQGVKFSTLVTQYMMFGLSKKRKHETREMRTAVLLSFDTPIHKYKDGGEQTIEDRLFDLESFDKYEKHEDEEVLSVVVKAFLQSSTPREKQIFEEVLVKGRGQKNLADSLGVSTSTIQSIKKNVVNKLRSIAANMDVLVPAS